MDILPNIAELRLGAAIMLVYIRLDIATTKLKQRALAVKLEVYETTTIKHSLSSVRPVGTYKLRFLSVLLTVHSFFQLLLNLISGTPWNYKI
jgi:hypothetical protein